VPKNKLAELITDNLNHFSTVESDDFEESGTARGEGSKRMKNAKWIATRKIQPDPTQPRKDFNDSSLKELAQSIGEYGIRQPIVVEFLDQKGHFQIVSGERRYRASQIIGLEEMPCIIQEQAGGSLRFAQQLIENIHREDFSPIDKARALLEYKAMLGKESPWLEVERKIGISETRRKQFVSLLNLPEEMQSTIVAAGKRARANGITEKHARALLRLGKMPEQQAELFSLMMNGKASMTGDEAIAMAKSLKGEESVQVFKVTYKTEAELISKLELTLSELKMCKNSEGSPG
jgi:ParB family chromosome partitioning protein